MIIAQHLLDEMVVQAREHAPFECCGIIGARDGEAFELYEARNVAPLPTHAYEMDGVDQFGIIAELEHARLDLGAIYHSHPIGPAYPSQTDVDLACHPGAVYVIIGLDYREPVVRGFTIIDGVVFEEPLTRG